MSRNYRREEYEWRRQQPGKQDDRWSSNRSDDDFSMGLGQESRESRGDEDYGRGGQGAWARSSGREDMRRGPGGRGQSFGGPREMERYSPEGYRGDSAWDERSDGFQNSSRWQRSQFRPSEGDFAERQQSGSNHGAEQFGGYEGGQNTRYRGEGQFAGRGPRNYTRSDDRIEEDINERLTRHGMLDASDVEVSVKNGEVTLRGSVDSRQAKRMAEDIVDAVFGVKDVTNQIKVNHRQESGAKGDNKQESETSGKQRKAS